MKKHLFVILIGLLIVGFGFAGVVSAQNRPNTAREMNIIREESNLNDDHEFTLVCSGEITHPVLMSLADHYGVVYEDLLVYFCEQEFGVGEIRLALITAERDDVALNFEEILQMRIENGMKQVGWGLIWQELGLIGWGRKNSGTENLNADHEGGVVCAGDMIHPVLKSLAVRYGVVYEELLVYFCEQEFGVGEIRLALTTAEREDVDGTYQDILDMRNGDGMKDVGWGLIWQELGLIGRGRQNHESENGPEGMNNKPAFPPGLGGAHTGKGVGPNK